MLDAWVSPPCVGHPIEFRTEYKRGRHVWRFTSPLFVECPEFEIVVVNNVKGRLVFLETGVEIYIFRASYPINIHRKSKLGGKAKNSLYTVFWISSSTTI
ncbi:hypothetical protein EYC84_003842 [Monilinia fructicola]|uniref:Uncharacterized protein n=1 Tax=Monilinia fructicola TaxID=38448 RepID=A0A5M9JYY6_MONFR|nr:hypothetical protein EYC84_003842 [Monilinia fructicola]